MDVRCPLSDATSNRPKIVLVPVTSPSYQYEIDSRRRLKPARPPMIRCKYSPSFRFRSAKRRGNPREYRCKTHAQHNSLLRS